MEKKYFEALLSGVEEMVAIENGEREPAAGSVRRYELPDVKAIRKNTGLKQTDFAKAIGVSTDLVRSWETHRRNPVGVALKMLRLVEREPALIDKLKNIPVY